MKSLSDLVEEISAAVVTADATDLPGLAALHGRFQSLQQVLHEAGPEPIANAVDLSHVTDAATLCVEKIILCEVDDTRAALQSLGQSIVTIQMLIAGPAAPQKQRQPAGSTGPCEQAASGNNGAPAAPATQAPAPSSGGAPTAETRLNPDDLPLVNEFITEAAGHIESAEAAILKLEGNSDDPEAINTVFRGFHTIKGVAGFLGLRQIGELAHGAESLLDLARKGKLQLAGPAIDLVFESMDAMRKLIAAVGAAVQSNQPIARHADLDSLLDRLRAMATGNFAPAPRPAPSNHPGPSTPKAAESPARPADSPGGDGTVKVATGRLDALINMVGELVIAQSMVSQDLASVGGANQRLSRNSAHLGKLTRELQELTMTMRMVPIQGVFQKMARLVRDLARKAGKEVELVTAGGETELDRNVVEAIHDPLVHMIRNSVDHGIEPPDARTTAGKGGVGRITLRARQQAGSIVIEVADDGRGLDKARILNKAIESGLIKEGQELPDQDIFKLIFHPGLSTAEKVTDVSGRGVGMDVVRRNIDALRGRIDIASTINQGTTFTIRLPLTLAVIDGLTVRVGRERYILPLTSVEQSLRPQPEQLSTIQGRGEICTVRGHLLPMFRLHNLFTVPGAVEDPTKAIVVIVQDNERRCALLVDDLLGQQQVVIKSLRDGVGAVQGVSGGAILSDGNISLILDVPGLVDLASEPKA